MRLWQFIKSYIIGLPVGPDSRSKLIRSIRKTFRSRIIFSNQWVHEANKVQKNIYKKYQAAWVYYWRPDRLQNRKFLSHAIIPLFAEFYVVLHIFSRTPAACSAKCVKNRCFISRHKFSLLIKFLKCIE
jgi:hypothetical protein